MQYSAPMRPLLLSMLAVLSAGLTFTAEASPFDGKWQIFTSIAGNDNQMTCTITVNDKALSGKCDSERGPVEITGKVDGNKASWSYKSEYQGSPLTVVYEGTLNPATGIQGSVNVAEFGVMGEFTAKQAK